MLSEIRGTSNTGGVPATPTHDAENQDHKDTENMTENEMSNLGAMSDRVGIMLKDDRATIGRRMLDEITLVPDQNEFRLLRML